MEGARFFLARAYKIPDVFVLPVTKMKTFFCFFMTLLIRKMLVFILCLIFCGIILKLVLGK